MGKAGRAFGVLMVSVVLFVEPSGVSAWVSGGGRVQPAAKGILSLPLEAQSSISAALGRDLPGYRVRTQDEAFEAVNDTQKPDIATSLSELVLDWQTGDVEFHPVGVFHQAVYLLWRESWRAGVCPECGRYFIAVRPPQRYCSPDCYRQAKQRRGLSWWRSHGAQWRQDRLKKKIRKNKKRGK